MSLFDPVDAYCERTDPSLWSEPVNALTNAAFLIAAAVMWVRLRGESDPTGRILCVLLGAIGVGSGLFHLFANRLTGIMDVVPILGFILAYVFAAHRRFWRQGQVAVPPAPRVVDTTGAGDAFNGAVLAAMMQGQGTEAAIAAGQRVAAVVIGQRGALVEAAALARAAG
ncbi:MAG: PfkB family carbohydrate kinase [Gemmobacter sp.]